MQGIGAGTAPVHGVLQRDLSSLEIVTSDDSMNGARKAPSVVAEETFEC